MKKTANYTNPPLLLNAREAAERLCVSERTIRNLVQRRKLRPVDWSRHLLFPPDQLEALAESVRTEKNARK